MYYIIPVITNSKYPQIQIETPVKNSLTVD